VGIGK